MHFCNNGGNYRPGYNQSTNLQGKSIQFLIVSPFTTFLFLMVIEVKEKYILSKYYLD